MFVCYSAYLDFNELSPSCINYSDLFVFLNLTDWIKSFFKKLYQKLVAPTTNFYFRQVKFQFPSFLQEAIAPKVGRTAKVIHMMMKATLLQKNIDLTKEQFFVLLCLEQEARPQSFLAMITERDKGSLTRLVQSLEKKEYVQRSVSESDGRVNYVELTPQGQKVLNNTKPLMTKMVMQLQDGIDEHEKSIALKVLQQVQGNALSELERIENIKNTK